MSRIRPGDKIGSLTVLEDSGDRLRGHIVWTCKCECGQIVKRTAQQFRENIYQDCGCSKSLIGLRFGKLVVTKDLGTKGKDHLWACECDCGNTCTATQDHLIQGLKVSCGCVHDVIGRENLRLVDGTSVTKLEAGRDTMNSNNTSGHKGVYEQNSHGKKTGRWVAQIGFKGKTYYLGCCDRIEDAVEARKTAEEHLYDGFLEEYYRKPSVAMRVAVPEVREKATGA